MNEENGKSIIAYLSNVDKEFARDFAKQRIVIARTCFEAGFVENLLDAPIIRNIINLLAPFIKNDKVKSAVKLLQDGLEEERRKQIKHKVEPKKRHFFSEQQTPKPEVKIHELE